MLQAWTLRRSDLARATSQHQVILAGVACLALVVTPAMWSLRSQQAIEAEKLRGIAAQLAAQVSALDEQTKSAMPTIARSDMLMRTHGTIGRYLLELKEVINSAPGRVVLDQLDSEVVGGELSIKLIATADDSGDMQRFVERAGMGKQVLASNQLLARKESATSTRIKFDYFKKVKVDK